MLPLRRQSAHAVPFADLLNHVRGAEALVLTAELTQHQEAMLEVTVA